MSRLGAVLQGGAVDVGQSIEADISLGEGKNREMNKTI